MFLIHINLLARFTTVRPGLDTVSHRHSLCNSERLRFQPSGHDPHLFETHQNFQSTTVNPDVATSSF